MTDHIQPSFYDKAKRYSQVRALMKRLEEERRLLETELAEKAAEFEQPIKTKWGQFSAVRRVKRMFFPEVEELLKEIAANRQHVVDKAMAEIKETLEQIDKHAAAVKSKAEAENKLKTETTIGLQYRG